MIKTEDKKNCKIKINNNTVKEYIKNTILTLEPVKNPICIINVGGPGSGKTYVSKIYIKNILKKNIKKFCIVNPDDILSKHFNNNTNCYQIDNNSPHKAINDLFDIAINNKYNILYDTTGINIKDIKSKIKLLKKNNYKINVCVCLIDDISIAVKRVKDRAKLTGRDMAIDYFFKRYEELPKVLNDFYFKLLYNTINEIIIYNSSDLKPKIQERYN
jgi:predicted ABC-type ATPase